MTKCESKFCDKVLKFLKDECKERKIKNPSINYNIQNKIIKLSDDANEIITEICKFTKNINKGK